MVRLRLPALGLATLWAVQVLPQIGGAVDVTVALKYSTYVGVEQTSGVNKWLGIRYAAAPIGDLRFMAPQDPDVIDKPVTADKHGKYCLETNKSPTVTETSEDCLFLDVYAPANATTSSKLPVFFFIQGGGFNGNTNPNLNGTGLVNASGNNIIVVTINYRVGPYGFLTDGTDITPNNGLLDQRKALQWVQDYITQFGGDPDHVVLGGDSAGAASISLHLIAHGGRDDGLFHAAAAESVSFASVYTVEQTRYQYDNFAVRLGCLGNKALACLQNKTAEELQAVNYNIPLPGAAAPPIYMYGPVVDGDLIPALTYKAFEEGKFIKVPVIFGDDTNGGTYFVPSNTSTLAQSNMFLKNQFPALTPAHLGNVAALYPNPNASSCPSTGCYWRQGANVYGEMRYMCPGLYISDMFTKHGVAQSWAYRWDVEDPAQVAAGLGVPHTVELNAIFGPENTNGDAPASYYPGKENANAVTVAQGYWTSFIRSFDPNTHRAAGSAKWDTWNGAEQGRLLVSTGGKTSMELLKESDLMKRCDFWFDIGVDILQ